MTKDALCANLREQYALHPRECERAALGVGSQTWFADCAEGRMVVKFPDADAISHPEQEAALCEHLLAQGIPASRFVRSCDGTVLCVGADGRKFHVQRFETGRSYAYHTAPEWLLDASAAMLGRIHQALRDYPELPVGIGADFFRYMTPDSARSSYERSLFMARKQGDAILAAELEYRIALMQRMPPFSMDLTRLSCLNTHGDYCINQLICGEGRINAVIDWTAACVHPAVWEIIRSYVYAAPECAAGRIDPVGLRRYVDVYMACAPLTAEDQTAMMPLFFYQLAVCDYYGQYYASQAPNRDIFLHQARFSTALLRHMEACGETLTHALVK